MSVTGRGDGWQSGRQAGYGFTVGMLLPTCLRHLLLLRRVRQGRDPAQVPIKVVNWGLPDFVIE